VDQVIVTASTARRTAGQAMVTQPQTVPDTIANLS
jgi:hypothetical protein